MLPEDSKSEQERRQVPRFIMPPGQFWVSDLDLVLGTLDVSVGGAALRLVDRQSLAKFAVGQKLKGELRALGAKHQGELLVRHIRGLTLGCEWYKPAHELTDFLKDHLSAAALGKTLKLHDLGEYPHMKWWHAPLGADLIFYKNVDESTDSTSVHSSIHSPINSWMLFLHGSLVAWDSDFGLRTGKTMAEDDETPVIQLVRLETRFIDYDAECDAWVIKSALELLEGAKAQLDDSDYQLVHQALAAANNSKKS